MTGKPELIPGDPIAPLLPELAGSDQHLYGKVYTASETNISAGSHCRLRGPISIHRDVCLLFCRCAQLPQFSVFGFGRAEDGNVGVGVLPQCKEILIGSSRSDGVALYGVSSAKLKACYGSQRATYGDAAVVQEFLELRRCFLALM